MYVKFLYFILKLNLIILEILYFVFFLKQDVNKWLQGKHEIEVLDQYMNIKKKLVKFKFFDCKIN